MTDKPKPKPRRKLTNLETVQALDSVVDRLTYQVLDLCDPNNWPQIPLDDPMNPTAHERIQQLAINSAAAKQAGNLAKLTQSVSNIAENRRRQLTLNNLDKPDRAKSDTLSLIAAAQEKAAEHVQDAQQLRVKQVH